MNQIRLLEVDYKNEDFISLCGELDEYLNIAIGGEDKREKYKKYNTINTMDYVVIAYDQKNPAGCAALRRYSETEIEIKRVFVRNSYRGKNIGGKLMEQLIMQAKEKGYSRMILETGYFLDASVRLYSRFGFGKIENYGDYKNMPESLCMGVNVEEIPNLNVIIKEIGKDERQKALDLVLAVFMQYEAPDYSKEGVESFQSSVMHNNDFLESITMYGAYRDETIVGVIATRKNGSHITLFFVDSKYHRQGIGKKLFETVLEHSSSNEITVNSSPYAVEVYHHLGFVDVASEQLTDGIRYTPMLYSKGL